MIKGSSINKTLLLTLVIKGVGDKPVISQALCRMSLLLTLSLGFHPSPSVSCNSNDILRTCACDITITYDKNDFVMPFDLAI